VCCSPDGSEETAIYYDAANKQLCVDTSRSGLMQGKKKLESGPFELDTDEPLNLRVFVDKSVVEVFANGRQAVTRRIYPSRRDSVGVALTSNGGATIVRRIAAWDMMPSNPY
jgi:beta-fructofuranosidase